MTPDPHPDPEPPLVIPVGPAPPLVLPAEPPEPARPRPGFIEACILTMGFATVLFGTVFGVLGVVLLYLVTFGSKDALTAPAGAEPGTAAAIPPDLVIALAWSFPLGYLAALGYASLILRIGVGRGWTREIGLRRLPVLHLALGLIALPGFVILSDVLARVLFRAFGMESLQDQSAALGDLFRSFHWSFAVLAVGVFPGIVEELWCRGFLGRGLVGRYGWAWGITLTSLFFGVLHLFPPPYVLVTAAMGACLHFTYVASRSLWVPMAIHLLNNSFAALMAEKVIPTEGMEKAMDAWPGTVTIAAACLLVFTALAMWRSRARLEGTGDPAKYRGIMVPPAGSGLRVVHSPPQLLLSLLAAGFSITLLALLFG